MFIIVIVLLAWLVLLGAFKCKAMVDDIAPTQNVQEM